MSTAIRFPVALVPLFACLFPLQARQVEISGNEPQYAGQTLVFYTTDNYITNSEIALYECEVASDGDFRAVFELDATRLLYLYLGIFKARLYAEPDMSYVVRFPPRTEKTPEEQALIFFEETPVYLHVVSATGKDGNRLPAEQELNLRMFRFDEMFHPMYDRLAVDAMKRKPVKPDSMISSLTQRTPPANHPYFDPYATYRAGMLYYAAQRAGVKHISNAYFSGKPVLYDNEAYMELFRVTYRDYFMYFGRTKEGQAIYQVINARKDFNELKRLLGKDGILSGDSLLEMVILQNIYDEFYSDRFSRSALLALLDAAIEQTAIDRHRETGRQIRSKITKLLRGYAPPTFSLYNQDSMLISPDTYKGKYVYLMFCTTQNYVCLSQYELLKEIHRIHGKWLRIVVIAVDEQFESMREFRRKSGYLWDYLHYARQPGILKDYDVRIFPACFLIDPEGKLVLSPAPEAVDIERSLFVELNNRGLWHEYIQKGWIDNKKLIMNDNIVK
ncbi:MAG: redoxin domain-containing protein [Bacteroidales bacterium]|jgi:hypothetical protein|nr:redoxin domain-containing protein [Bacteroidales bacterium]